MKKASDVFDDLNAMMAKRLGLANGSRKSVDPTVYDLASDFLADTGAQHCERDVQRLAEAIQDTIEDEIEAMGLNDE